MRKRSVWHRRLGYVCRRTTLTARGRKVLLIDIAPDAKLTQRLGIDPVDNKGYSIKRSKNPLERCGVSPIKQGNQSDGFIALGKERGRGCLVDLCEHL